MTISLDLHNPVPGVIRFTVPLVLGSPDHLHVHVLETPEGPLVVDTGAKGSESAFEAGLTGAKVDTPRVLLTHGHLDHWGIAAQYSATVYAHPEIDQTFAFARGDFPAEGVAPGVADGETIMRAFARFQELVGDVPAVIPVRDGDRFGDWTALHTPGHDPAHLCLYRAADRTLVCGDLLLPGFTPNVQPTANGADTLAAFLASVRRVAALPIDLVLPAHGEAYADARGRAQELLDHHTRRLEQLGTALGTGRMTLDALTSATFGARANTREDRMLALMETYAHLNHLRRQNVARQRADGSWEATA
jgi:glyoxylase-like metal-dependent hydrolase (beta-lactamase superfamily II)